MGLPALVNRKVVAIHGSRDERRLPYNIEAEQSLLGALLINNESYHRVMKEVPGFGPDAFMEEVHARIWAEAEDLITAGRIATPIILKTYLGEDDLGGGVSPFSYMVRLSAEATTVINAPEYARLVLECSVRRQIIAAAKEVSDLAYGAPSGMSCGMLWSELETRLERARPPSLLREQTGFVEFGQIDTHAVYEAYRTGGEASVVGLSTGFPRLDDAMGGLAETDLIVLGGRTAMGKTVLGSNIAFNVARHLRETQKEGVVGFFSLEQGLEQIKTRAICAMSGVQLWKVKRGIATKDEMARWEDARREFDSLPVAIDPTSSLTIQELTTRARRLKKQRGLRLLVVDYLQKVSCPSKSDFKPAEITKIAEGLKNLAKDLEIPVIALAQVGRDVEKRDDPRPRLADLADGKSIETEADTVILLYREEYYVQKRKPAKEGNERFLEWERDMRRCRGIADVYVAKSRHGPETVVQLGWEGECVRFLHEPEPREYEPEPLQERRKKAKSLPPAALALAKGLENLALWNKGRIAQESDYQHDRELMKGAVLIPYAAALEKFRNDFAPTLDDAALAVEMRNAFKALFSAGMARFYREKGCEAPATDGLHFWRPDLISD